ncbi:ectoine/hydroxyectoine ABC transporter substrate-binding protein EhuB [Azospirillum thermophilum]|uniref:Ectoine/hydroxyectoine ABC transporter substrate-binding protein EhuB n=1 Tax=Azospirillum thermophilum TaxID=2202148 RepID=A0A2S2CWL4_9PROT|nr:ectoine/hydroxyectoine ABC transporter substrate-binding protein EhuB [Azospirillum thermophilum]AWK88790.1 ectoine/hydroxyectoine ABC transporter substrate-binding protein EhuB [Azospirillum thermophilum]
MPGKRRNIGQIDRVTGPWALPRPAILALVLALALALVLVAGHRSALAQAAVAEATLDRILRTGEVRIGYAPEQPFSFRSPDGQLGGIGPAVARQVFAALGVTTMKGVESEFSALIPDLLARRYDVIVSGLSVRPERCRRVAFSDPFFRAGSAFAVRAGNPRDLHGYADVARNPAIRLGAVFGTVEIDDARASGVAGEQILLFPDAATAASGVRSGRVDAYAARAPTVENLVQRSPRLLERAAPFEEPVLPGRSSIDHGAFAFRPEDGDLRAAFNARLTELLRTPDYPGLIGRFGFTASELPARRLDELCRTSRRRHDSRPTSDTVPCGDQIC